MSSVRILGPVEVWAGDRQLALGGSRQVALLTLLVVHANRAVSTDVLIDALWAQRSGASARKRLQMVVARLRQTLEPLRADSGPVVRTVAGGYLLALEAGAVDADVFAERVGDGLGALQHGEPGRAAELFGSALELWRGPPLAEVSFEDFAQGEIRHLEELRLVALEARIDADLQVGRHAQLIGELEGLLAQHPARERLAELLMLALYRCGRQADALAVHQRIRTYLSETLGLQPGTALSAFQAQILEQAPELQALTAMDSDVRDRSSSEGQAARRSAGLPFPLTQTIGREHEVEKVSEMLLGPGTRLVTLSGPGGVGKTRLAIVVARALESLFADGVCWVELAGVERRDDVSSTIARALAVTPMQTESSRDALHRYLARKQMLLVIDNFEHLLEAGSVVSELLSACGGVTVLSTSREALGLSAEHLVAVSPLELPVPRELATVTAVESTAATTLFLDAARRHDARVVITAETAPIVAGICRRLDGLPLALELAAARIGLLGVKELSSELNRALKLGAGPRDAPARHRTLEATIDWSFRLLDGQQQSAFGYFAVFAGGASVLAAEAVTSTTRETLEALTAKSLLDRRSQPDGATRLMMLETIRSYASHKLAEDPDQHRVRRRHCDYYLHLVEQTVPRLSTHGDREALAVLDIELANFLVALQWALDCAPAIALRLAGHLGEYWLIRRDLDGLDWLDAALRAAGSDAPVQDIACARFQRAMQFCMRDDWPAAVKDAETALLLYRRAGNDAGMARVLGELAVCTGMAVGDLEQERRLAEEACRHARAAGDERELGRSLAVIASVSGNDRRPLLDQAAKFLSGVGDFRGIAIAYSNAAYIALTEDRIAEAASLLGVALKAAQRTDSPVWNMNIQSNIGLARLFSGRLVQAREAFQCSLRACVENAFRTNGESLAGLAAVVARDGRYEIAARLRGAARSAGYPPSICDKSIDERLELEFFAPARERYGSAEWSRCEEAGAALSNDDAIRYALREATDRCRSTETAWIKLTERSRKGKVCG